MLVWSRRDLLKAIPLAALPPALPKTGELPQVADAPQLFVDFDQVDVADNVVRTFYAAENGRKAAAVVCGRRVASSR